jgi:hypothetical protein
MREDCVPAYQQTLPDREHWWQLSYPLLPAVGLAILPKCPFCLIALASSIGLGYLARTWWLVPLTSICFVAAVGSLAMRARRRRTYAPLYLGLSGLVIVFLSKYQLNNTPLTYMGLALLVFASLWRGTSKTKSPDNTGCKC